MKEWRTEFGYISNQGQPISDKRMGATMNTRRNWWTIIASLAIVLTCSIGVRAQKGPPPRHGPGGPGPQGDRGPGHGPGRPFGGGLEFLSSEMRFGDKVVKGAPYSAEAVLESTQTLSDGTHITRKSNALIYRDGEGRTRREQTMEALGPFAVSGDAPRLISINDPVSGVNYILDPSNKTARKMSSHGGPPPPHQPPPSSESKTESLGKQTIEGVEAEGTRSTVTIPAGQIGNDRPLEIVSERWYSAVLQTVVLSKHKDPRMGETVYRLTNINRSEPARSLFEVPSDYKVEERTPPDRMRGVKRDRED